MKSLFLVRHAKSSWKFPELDDFERPLNKRGKTDAPLMGKLLKSKKVHPDIILSSSAIRAASTAKIIAKALAYPVEDILLKNEIYDAGIPELMQTIQAIDDNFGSALLVGHNPGLTFLANYLADHMVTNIPTCGIYAMELDISKWNQTGIKCGKFTFLDFPKGQH